MLRQLFSKQFLTILTLSNLGLFFNLPVNANHTLNNQNVTFELRRSPQGYYENWYCSDVFDDTYGEKCTNLANSFMNIPYYEKVFDFLGYKFAHIYTTDYGKEYWIDRSQSRFSRTKNGYTRYVHMVKGTTIEGISIALIDGNCHADDYYFIIRNVNDFDKTGKPLLNQPSDVEETVYPLPNSLGMTILLHVCQMDSITLGNSQQD